MDPNHDIYSGVYLGDDIGTGQGEVVPPSFDYTVHKYGDEKKKGKKNKQSSSDETRYLQHLASKTDEQAQEPNMKMRYFDVDSQGLMYEREKENLLLGIERLQPNIFCPSAAACGDMHGGGDGSISFSEHKPPEYLSSCGINQTFEEFVPYFSGKNRNATSLEKVNPKSLPTKDVFDEYGIFLGE